MEPREKWESPYKKKNRETHFHSVTTQMQAVVTIFYHNIIFLPSLFPAILGKAPGLNWEEMIALTSKLGEINDIEHNKSSKTYPQNQIILDCIMPSIPLKHKCLFDIIFYVPSTIFQL